MDKNRKLRKSRKTVPALLMWEIRNEIVKLINDLRKLNLEIDDLYGHLTRDIGVSRSTLEKVISIRRYFPDRKDVPKDHAWNAIREAPKRYARELKQQ